MTISVLLRYLLIAIAVFLTTACVGMPERNAPERALSATEQTIIYTSMQLIGVPYRYGGASLEGVDCSGLVQLAYNNAGIRVPRTSREQYRQSKRVHPTRIKPGDLVFFRLQSRKISHVGIYIGNKRFIHAPRTGKNVMYASLENPFWKKRYAGAGRFKILNNTIVDL